MRKVFLFSLTLLLISGTAYANPFTVNDFADIGGTDYVSHGWGSVTDLGGAGDWVRWKHQYKFTPPVSSILSATLTLRLIDNETDKWYNPFSFEIGLGVTEGGTWGVGEVDTGDFTFNLGLNGLQDEVYYVTLASLWGDFSIFSSELVINYLSDTDEPGDIGASPVPEPANMLLFGTGLIGLAGTFRKKLFKN